MQRALGERGRVDPWGTVDVVRSVLFVCRTVQATNRLLYDVMPLLEDTRVQVYFTVDASTQFGEQVPRLLDREGVKLIPWHVAVSDFDCDVTVTASANENLPELPGAKVVMAHGAGYHKWRAGEVTDEDAVSGLSPRQLLVDGRVHPAAVVLAGPEQFDRLRTDCPQAESRAVLIGDVCAERLHAALPHRDRYRRHLGVRRHQRLIVLTSTWRFDSLLNRAPELALRLLEELSADDHRVAFVMHPNGWDRHGKPGIEGFLRTARRAGLIVIPPHEGWRAAVVASDCVVGDHGSVGFYAADLGRPLLYAAFSEAEIPGDSPAAMLAAAAPFLDHDAPLAPQIDAAIAGHHPERHRHITRLALDAAESPSRRLRELLYRLLDLEPTAEPVVPRPFPLPDAQSEPVTAWHVHPVGEPGSPPRLLRFPITTARAAHDRRYPERVLTVDAAEPDQQLRFAASVLTWSESTLCPDDATHWADTTLAEFLGADVAVVRLPDGRMLVRHRRYGDFLAASRSEPEPCSVGAAMYRVGLAGAPPAALVFAEGSRQFTVELSRCSG